jgi:5-hydroxyisourate hydrolase-like protein (transthyretin family)
MINESDGDFIFLVKRRTNYRMIRLCLRFAFLATLIACAPVSGTRRGERPPARETINGNSTTAGFYTLVGMVFDSTSGKPLEGVQVLLREDPAVQPYFVQTDRAGAFVLSSIKTGHYQLLVRMIGYMPYVGQQDARAGGVDTLRIRMGIAGEYHYTFPINAVAPTSKNTRTIPCRRPTIVTASWYESRLSRVPIALRMPRWFKRESAEAHVDSLRLTTGDTALTGTSLTTNKLGVPRAALDINVVDAVTLAYAGDKMPEESECHEQIGGAQAVVFSFNQSVAVGDMAYVGPYIILAQLRFPDGLSLDVFGDAEKREQQDDMLTAIRTIRRIPRAR